MSSALVYHHLGLGDHFLLNGLVREIGKKHERVGLFAKPGNLVSVRAMYRDLPHLTVIPADDAAARRYILLNRFFLSGRYRMLYRIGFEHLDRTSGQQFEEQFYAQAGLPLSAKWDSFHIERDAAGEEALRAKIGAHEPYLFLHEDEARGYGIDRSRLPHALAVVTPERSYTDNILDYAGVFERASEIHVIDSSFMFFIDCLPYEAAGQKLFVHRYARENPAWTLPVLKKKWTILT